MKDIKLITYHNALSYGACLQAFATVKILKKSGGNVQVIDFENAYESRQKELGFLKHGSAKEIVATLVKRFFFKNEICKKRAFGKFKEKYDLTEQKYYNVSEMQDIVADTFVVGSDQVWNPEISGAIEPAFFLDFGKADRRISLSSSMGSYCYDSVQQDYVKKQLDKFDAISVREDHAKCQLEQAGINKEIKVTLDPTLLVDDQEWVQFYKISESNLISEKKYILAFVIGNHKREEISEIFKYYSSLLGLPIWRIMLNTHRTKNVDRVIAGATPEEFVELIDKASFVITDSFHGTAFSINMKTPFALLLNANAARMTELVKKCNLKSRIIKPGYYPDPKECCFDDSEKYLNRKRNEDLCWIKSNI